MKKPIITSGLIALTLTLAACSNDEANNQNIEETSQETETTESTESESTQTESSETEENQTINITDSADHQVEVPLDPQTVAAFDNGQLDNLDALGLGERVVATASSKLPNYLSDYAELPVTGTLHEVNVEEVASIDPEFSIVAGRSKDGFDSLSQFIPTIDLSNNVGDSWENLQQNLNTLGEIFQKEDEANQLLADLEPKISSLEEEASQSGKEALVLMYSEGSLSAFGPDSRFGFVHENFGFQPADSDIEASKHGMDVSFEYVLEEDPDVIFVIDRGQAIDKGPDDFDTTFLENPLIQETKAYENDKIISLTPDVWYLAEGGVQAYNQMVDEVQEAL